jgi:hypothetical protein
MSATSGRLLHALFLLSSMMGISAEFVVNYKAEFSYFLGFFCEGEYPVVMVVCQDGGQIQLVEDPVPSTVVCSPTPATDLPPDASSAITCTTDSCDGDPTCGEAWITRSLDEANFAEIHYSCSGESVDQVKSYFSFLNSGGGTCGVCDLALDLCIYAENFNFHVARLSVLCPPFESADDYVYEDTFTECQNGFSAPEVIFDGPSHSLNCLSGTNCEFNPCDVDFGENMNVLTSPHSFQQCIQSSTVSNTIPPQVDQPQAMPATTPGKYTAQFSASFGFIVVDPDYWLISFGSNPCSSETPTTKLQIVCTQGGTITFLESTVSTVTCEKEGSDTLLCRDSVPLINEDSSFGVDTSSYFNFFQQISYVSSTERPA